MPFHHSIYNITDATKHQNHVLLMRNFKINYRKCQACVVHKYYIIN